MQIQQIGENVYQIDNQIATVNLTPTKQVYQETLLQHEDKEFRLWNPRRSKLAAAIIKGLRTFPFKKDSKVLYLGASAGTTPSHISDICSEGRIYSVEFSPTMMREFLDVSKNRKNLIPLLEDATRPENYQSYVECVDVIYSDVAQAQQTKLFIDNFKMFSKEDTVGILMIKARSIDVTRNPNEIFKQEKRHLEEEGLKVIEEIKLNPYEKDHIAFICKQMF
ncbi:fibrillarin-like rRNA/tRNA 2'-O-methyltransferase [Methanosphaera cuniculi]|uniref:Fibrillarin-like rRNA/tRNA 2'-O-methyltransferase n=1 Tax=Methanosphaera cuniculi TaxID=1077256 RepID=A0A2A2HG43_9EURY|nr:fibrillarin-like rRNA/tRNA 2'-O-methyltransferase [Methanosphaera cuniculi]PAV08244.1 fibrillarin [Methanosphaera cuniculi]PWL08331.1 fibrillarin [Methanosphaera cuniculi]